MWSRWLNITLHRSRARMRPSLQEERILQLADWIEEETEAAEAAKDAALNSELQKFQ